MLLIFIKIYFLVAVVIFNSNVSVRVLVMGRGGGCGEQRGEGGM